ncbi:MAG TPA: hypothetical protein PKE26_13770 [Kiritimatiellia bacterium]|nr:hypothetical protein [Kiritimatiellia bacterium]HMP00170.1 hypothetical protein [Kiritimatiellia bacterium]HMP96805.1 hypothetical protein [Kiritimatiellia bacterium]
MLTCKQVSRALAEGDYASLPLGKRLGLKAHVALCAVCGQYNRQLMVMQDTIRAYRRREEADPVKPEALSEGDKAAIKAALRRTISPDKK